QEQRRLREPAVAGERPQVDTLQALADDLDLPETCLDDELAPEVIGQRLAGRLAVLAVPAFLAWCHVAEHVDLDAPAFEVGDELLVRASGKGLLGHGAGAPSTAGCVAAPDLPTGPMLPTMV